MNTTVEAPITHDITKEPGYATLPEFDKTIAQIVSAAHDAFQAKCTELDANNGQAFLAALALACQVVMPEGATGSEDVPPTLLRGAAVLSMSGQEGFYNMLKAMATVTRGIAQAGLDAEAKQAH